MVRWAIDPQITDREVPDQVLKNIRVELFKMYYEKNEFVLNAKADAFETLQTLLSCIHVYYSSKIMKPKAKGDSKTPKKNLAEFKGFCLYWLTRCHA